jgi:hypothetical protein
MKKINVMMFLGLTSFLMSCSSPAINYHFGEEYAWICTTKDNAKIIGDYYKVPGEPEKTCAKVEADKDPVRDFYLRDWEKGNLPPFPDTP